MPGGDRSGPMGRGPMTGRGAGFCSGSGVAGFMNRGGGGGGRGRGGRGWRNMFYATGQPGWARAGIVPAPQAPNAPVEPHVAPAPAAHQSPVREQELDALKQQAEQAASVLQDIRRRIDELEGTAE